MAYTKAIDWGGQFKNIMKRTIIAAFVFILLSTFSGFAQDNQLFIMHTLKKGETLSALAKQFKTTVGDIMRLNGMHADSKLVLGSEIKIPMVAGSVPEPVIIIPEKAKEVIENSGNKKQTYIVQKGETLYGISKQFNVSVDQLRRINNLEDNNLEVGQILIVSDWKENASAITEKGIQVESANNDKAIVAEDAAIKKQRVSKKDKKPVVPKIENSGKSDEEIASLLGKDGYFAGTFALNSKGNKMHTQTGQAMTFKTESGWKDYKYYVLMNNMAIGTIVKLTAISGRFVFAKVIWDMGDLKENLGLTCRISNATAAALGINTNIFELEISYY